MCTKWSGDKDFKLIGQRSRSLSIGVLVSFMDIVLN